MKFTTLAAIIALLPMPGVSQAQESLPLVKLTTIESTGVFRNRTFFGRVAARETVELAFQVAGQIVEFPAIEGQPIPEGGLIAQLDLEPFHLSLDQARAQADQANRTLERFERLQGNAVSEVSVQDARTQADLTAIALRNAERSLEQATLTAPFDALVASRLAPNYATLGVGTPIVRLHDMSDLRIEIEVPEVLFQRAGDSSEFDLKAVFPTSETRYPVSPREFNAETSAVGQTFQITLGMAPPEGIVVLPGSSATVEVTFLGTEARPEIPRSALVMANDGTPQVLVFSPKGAEEGRVALTPIEIEPTEDGRIALVSGLEIGQEIVASGGTLLEDGAQVRRFTGF